MAAELERVLIRRALPFMLPAVIVAFLIGALTGGQPVGWSAAIGVMIVEANFVAHGLSLAWASQISLVVLFAVGMGGFVIRLGVIVLIMFGLNQFSWFSPVAFGLALVPGTVVLLVFEMKQLSGRMQADLWTFEKGHLAQ
ncbi:MAG: hypothetical protein QOE83_1704 [Actinomycetota bacterium]|jgi:hypothetical protein|nr:hypothetical protein [Actinomycetota bacterium]